MKPAVHKEGSAQRKGGVDLKNILQPTVVDNEPPAEDTKNNEDTSHSRTKPMRVGKKSQKLDPSKENEVSTDVNMESRVSAVTSGGDRI